MSFINNLTMSKKQDTKQNTKQNKDNNPKKKKSILSTFIDMVIDFFTM